MDESQKQLHEIIPDLSSMPPLHAEWLVSGLIPEGSLTMISGPPGGGKSTFVLNIAGAVSTGRSFAGRATKKAPVLYLDRENPQWVAQSRLVHQKAKTSENFLYWGNWVLDENGTEITPPALNDLRITSYVKQCEQKPLIVLDSMVAFYGGDENDAKAMRTFLQYARRLAQRGAAVIFIHHSGKSETSQEYRGSSDIPAALDLGFFLKKINSGQMLEKVQLRPWKTRFLVEEEAAFIYQDGQFSPYVLSIEEKSKAAMKGVIPHAPFK